jgi:hypothetical protein
MEGKSPPAAPRLPIGRLAWSPPFYLRGVLERQDLGQRAAVEGGDDLAGDAIGGCALGVVREMRVARRRDRMLVAEQRAENRQPQAGAGAEGREAVAIMPTSA